MAGNNKKKTNIATKSQSSHKKNKEIDEDNNLHKQPVFRFSSIDGQKFKLSNWEKHEIEDLMKCFQKMEKLTWNQILNDGGLKPKILRDFHVPNHVSEDKSIMEVRVCQKKRLMGYRDKNVFYLVWFDRGHEATVKRKKHG